MRKFMIMAALAATVVMLGACDAAPEREGPTAESIESALENYDRRTSDTTTPDADGPAVDREDTMTSTERERFGSWDGTGDTPYGDDSDNDGRFSDVTCGGWHGSEHKMTCTYGDGTIAAIGIDYVNAGWVWGITPISQPGQCPSESMCLVTWDHATTSPVVVPVPGG